MCSTTMCSSPHMAREHGKNGVVSRLKTPSSRAARELTICGILGILNSSAVELTVIYRLYACMRVCMCMYDLLRTALIRSNQIKPVRIYTHSNQSRFHQTSHHSQQSFNQEIKKYIAIETTPAGTKHFGCL